MFLFPIKGDHTDRLENKWLLKREDRRIWIIIRKGKLETCYHLNQKEAKNKKKTKQELTLTIQEPIPARHYVQIVGILSDDPSQQVGSADKGLVYNPSLLSRTHIKMEGENWLHKVILWPSRV